MTASEATTSPSPGSAVVGLGAADGGGEAVAVWQVSPEGEPTGAWVVPSADAFASADSARQLLFALEGRAVTAVDPDVVDKVLTGLGAAALPAADEGWWAPCVFSVTSAFGELVQRRREYEETVETRRQSLKTITRLEWPRDFAWEDVPTEVDGLRQLARLAVAPGVPVVSQALMVSRILRWLIKLWHETEQVKRRRGYVAVGHGQPEPLPPSWWAAVQAASTSRVPA